MRDCPTVNLNNLAELTGLTPPASGGSGGLLELAQEWQARDPVGFAAMASSPETLVQGLDHRIPTTPLDAKYYYRPDNPVPVETGIGVFDPATATWYLRDSASSGAPTVTPFQYGAPGWIPVAGDWDGDGTTTIGVFDPNGDYGEPPATWYLRNSNSPGAPDWTGSFGGGGWTPLVGHWDGQPQSRIGAVDPATNLVHQATRYGVQTAAYIPPSGDGPPQVSPGVWYDAVLAEWYINGHAPFAYGAPDWIPLVGTF